MTKPDDETKPSHAPGSQPSARPGSDQPQTVPVPTPPVARTSGPDDPADLADVRDESEPQRGGEDPASDG